MLLTEQHEFGWLETFDVSQVQVNEAEDDEYADQGGDFVKKLHKKIRVGTDYSIPTLFVFS